MAICAGKRKKIEGQVGSLSQERETESIWTDSVSLVAADLHNPLHSPEQLDVARMARQSLNPWDVETANDGPLKSNETN